MPVPAAIIKGTNMISPFVLYFIIEYSDYLEDKLMLNCVI